MCKQCFKEGFQKEFQYIYFSCLATKFYENSILDKYLQILLLWQQLILQNIQAIDLDTKTITKRNEIVLEYNTFVIVFILEQTVIGGWGIFVGEIS